MNENNLLDMRDTFARTARFIRNAKNQDELYHHTNYARGYIDALRHAGVLVGNEWRRVYQSICKAEDLLVKRIISRTLTGKAWRK